MLEHTGSPPSCSLTMLPSTTGANVVKLIGITVPLVAGIMPLTSMKGLHRMAELAAGTNFPAKLQREIYRHQDDPKAVQQVGIEWATEQCRDLLEQEAAGIHFYTLNNSDATMQIFRSLGAKDASALR